MTGLVIGNDYQLNGTIISEDTNWKTYGVISLKTGRELSLVAKVVDLTSPGGFDVFQNEISTLKKLSGIRGVLKPVGSYQVGNLGVILFPRLRLDLIDLFLSPDRGPPCMVCVLSLVSEILAQCHRKGVAHMDIKPENILVSDSGKIFLVNFGASCDVSKSEKKLARGLAGTPVYMPPEMVSNQYFDIFKADSWSLGICAFVCYFGKFPYTPSFIDTLERGLINPLIDLTHFVRAQIQSASSIPKSCSDNLNVVISQHLMVADPQFRSSPETLVNSGALKCACCDTAIFAH